MTRRAFTLIELLVVIAIIAILAAILFPVFAQAKEAAKKTTCLSHSKEVGIGIMLYIGDYDDTYPKGYYYELNGPTVGRRVQWAYTLQPYIKSQQMFKCPTDFLPTPPATSGGYQDLSVPELSYIPNYAVMPAHDGGHVSAGAVGEAANVIIFAEKQYKIGAKTLKSYAGASGFIPDSPVNSDYCRSPIEYVKAAIKKPSDSNYKLVRVAFDRHTGGKSSDHSGNSNFVFCDGHAKNLTIGQTLGDSFKWGESYYAGSSGRLLDDATCLAALPKN